MPTYPAGPADLQVLTGWDAIRRRPVMYVGPLNNPKLPTQMLGEALHLTRTAARLGEVKKVTVRIFGRLVYIVDDGPGWDVSMSVGGKRVAERMLSEMHACRGPDHAHTCNIGLMALIALSSEFLFVTFRDGYAWEQVFREGHPLTPFERHGESSHHGTVLSFILDPTVLPGIEIQRQHVEALTDELKKDGITLEIVP